MVEFAVAHVREQGQDMIIVPMKREFGLKAESEQHQLIGELQQVARKAGLAGTVVTVWEASRGRMAFIAPRPWHPFFRSIGLSWVAANINRKLIVS
jgi:hypothetical protein